MADQLFIGIDSGTQGCKVLVFSRKLGRVLSECNSPHKLIENDRGGREQDPAIWVDALNTAMSEALKSIDTSLVRAISVSGQQHGFVPLDAAGEVIRPAKLWCDTETVAECDSITHSLGGERQTIERLGNLVAAGFTASKILWMKNKEPENYRRLKTIMLPHDYLNYYLSGEMWMEHGDSSGTAFYEVKNRCWSTAALKAIDNDRDLSLCLPPLREAAQPCATIKPELASRWGLPEEVVIATGGGDNMMAAIGTGNVSEGIITASLGTSGTIYGYSDTPVIDPKGELTAFCSSSGGWLPLICTMNVTVATELIRELFSLSLETFNNAVESALPGCSGIMLLPFFNGERTPALPNGTATLHGLTSTNLNRENICRAAIEGVTLGLRYGLEALERNGLKPDEIRLVGGGARSDVWRQIVADCFDTPVVSPMTTEAGALGAALQAMWCHCNQHEGKTELRDICDQYVILDPHSRKEPEKSRAAIYTDLYQEYLNLERTIRPLNH